MATNLLRCFVIRYSSLILVSGFVILVSRSAAVAASSTPTSRRTLDVLRDSLTLNYGTPDVHLALAKALQQQGDFLTAFQICEDTRQLFGGELFIASFKRVFFGNDLPLAHARGEVLQTALKLDPKNPALLREMANVCAQQGRDEPAVHYYRRAAEVMPNDYSIIDALSLSLLAMGQEHESQAVVEQWCTQHPDAQAAWEHRVRVHLRENSDDAPLMLDAAIAKFPGDGALRLMRGQLLLDQKREAAGADLIAAAALAKDSADAQGAAGRFYLKVRGEPARALPYYLNAYFLNPDYSDWERVNERIPLAAVGTAAERLMAANSTDALIEAMLDEKNPFVAAAAIRQASTAWDDRLVEPLVQRLTADAPEVRQAATALLLIHRNSHLQERLPKLLADPNPLMRGAAATLDARFSMAGAVASLTPLLSDRASVVRLMTAEALIQDGAAAGRAAVTAHQRNETDAWVHSAIAAALAGE